MNSKTVVSFCICLTTSSVTCAPNNLSLALGKTGTALFKMAFLQNFHKLWRGFELSSYILLQESKKPSPNPRKMQLRRKIVRDKNASLFKYQQFLEKTVVPWIKRNSNVTFQESMKDLDPIDRLQVLMMKMRKRYPHILKP